MGDIISSDVATDWDITADQIRRALRDLRYNHNHDGTKGVEVDHSDYEDGPIPNTYHDHHDLWIHMMGPSVTTFADSPGGDAGVHDLGSNYYLMGASGGMRICDEAHGSTDRWDGGEYGVQRGRAAFEQAAGEFFAFPSTPFGFFCALSDEPMMVSTHQRLTTSIAWKVIAGMPTSTKRDAQSTIHMLQVALGAIE